MGSLQTNKGDEQTDTIFATWILGMLCEAAGLYQPDGASFPSLYPDFHMTSLSALGSTLGKCFTTDFQSVRMQTNKGDEQTDTGAHAFF